MKDREVTLKLNSRPLKLAYLVRNTADLFDAILLYTHLWGGGANYILPLPDKVDETIHLEEALRIVDPDYILIPIGEDNLPDLEKKLPARQRPISNHAIQKHIMGEDFYRFPTGDLNHIIPVIDAYFPDGISSNNSLIGVVESSSDITNALHFRLPTKVYHNYLSSRCGAKTFRTPLTIQEEIQLKLVFSQRTSLRDFTLAKIKRNWDGFNTDAFETNDPETLCLFLGNDQAIDVCTAFWNTRWTHSKNKLFLDKETFLQDINSHINLIIQWMPLMRALAIFVKASREEANDIYHTIKQVFSSINRDLCVRVQYSGFKYNLISGKLSFEEPNTFTRQIYLDDSVRFTPNPPLGHDKEKLFGFDAEVTFSSGVKFSLPSTNIISKLLSNEIERVELAEKYGETFDRQESITRATDKGITGITKGGMECRFYAHPNDIFVDHFLKSLGFQIKVNKLTRYAQGFIKKLGGFEKARRLVDQGGLQIISLLNDKKAQESGLEHNQMMKSLGNALKDCKEALSTIKKCLPEMLSAELIRRGYSLTCSHCDLKAWYSIDTINEFVECIGCAESFQLQIEKIIPFAYQPNELASRFLQQGGEAVLTTANILYQIDRAALLTFGGHLLRIGENENFAEADLLWLSRHVFAIAECKCRYYKLDDIEEIRVSLGKNLEAAVQIGAQVVFLGIYTYLEDVNSLFDLIQSFSESSTEKKVAIHLIINSDLYLWGQQDHKVERNHIHTVQPEELLLEHKSFFDELRRERICQRNFLLESSSLPSFRACVPVTDLQIAVGEKPGSYGGIVGGETYNAKILSDWEEAFLINQTS